MPVIVEMPAALRQFAGDQDTLNSSGKTVEEVFSELCSTYPELKKNLYGSDGKIRSFINISSKRVICYCICSSYKSIFRISKASW